MTPQTIILTGAYGSGKTECALALALHLALREPVTLIDFDFVNPYFRAQDHRRELESAAVRVIAPDARVAAIDAPALPAEAREAMLRPSGQTVVDLGGDPAGAIVMGQFAPALACYELWGVVNFARPTTTTPQQAADLLRDIAHVTRLRLSGLVSNTHFGEYTTVDDVLGGLTLTRALGQLLTVPVRLVCAQAGLTLPPVGLPFLPITRRLLRPWEEGGSVKSEV
jgi:hypothetical protein